MSSAAQRRQEQYRKNRQESKGWGSGSSRSGASHTSRTQGRLQLRAEHGEFATWRRKVSTLERKLEETRHNSQQKRIYVTRALECIGQLCAAPHWPGSPEAHGCLALAARLIRLLTEGEGENENEPLVPGEATASSATFQFHQLLWQVLHDEDPAMTTAILLRHFRLPVLPTFAWRRVITATLKMRHKDTVAQLADMKDHWAALAQRAVDPQAEESWTGVAEFGLCRDMLGRSLLHAFCDQDASTATPAAVAAAAAMAVVPFTQSQLPSVEAAAVEALVPHCGDPDAPDDLGRRPLCIALQNGRLSAALTLVKCGAEMTTKAALLALDLLVRLTKDGADEDASRCLSLLTGLTLELLLRRGTTPPCGVSPMEYAVHVAPDWALSALFARIDSLLQRSDGGGRMVLLGDIGDANEAAAGMCPINLHVLDVWLQRLARRGCILAVKRCLHLLRHTSAVVAAASVVDRALPSSAARTTNRNAEDTASPERTSCMKDGASDAESDKENMNLTASVETSSPRQQIQLPVEESGGAAGRDGQRTEQQHHRQRRQQLVLVRRVLLSRVLLVAAHAAQVGVAGWALDEGAFVDTVSGVSLISAAQDGTGRGSARDSSPSAPASPAHAVDGEDEGVRDGDSTPQAMDRTVATAPGKNCRSGDDNGAPWRLAAWVPQDCDSEHMDAAFMSWWEEVMCAVRKLEPARARWENHVADIVCGSTPLHLATTAGSHTLVALLLERGASLWHCCLNDFLRQQRRDHRVDNDKGQGEGDAGDTGRISTDEIARVAAELQSMRKAIQWAISGSTGDEGGGGGSGRGGQDGSAAAITTTDAPANARDSAISATTAGGTATVLQAAEAPDRVSARHTDRLLCPLAHACLLQRGPVLQCMFDFLGREIEGRNIAENALEEDGVFGIGAFTCALLPSSSPKSVESLGQLLSFILNRSSAQTQLRAANVLGWHDRDALRAHPLATLAIATADGLRFPHWLVRRQCSVCSTTGYSSFCVHQRPGHGSAEAAIQRQRHGAQAFHDTVRYTQLQLRQLESFVALLPETERVTAGGAGAAQQVSAGGAEPSHTDLVEANPEEDGRADWQATRVGGAPLRRCRPVGDRVVTPAVVKRVRKWRALVTRRDELHGVVARHRSQLFQGFVAGDTSPRLGTEADRRAAFQQWLDMQCDEAQLATDKSAAEWSQVETALDKKEFTDAMRALGSLSTKLRDAPVPTLPPEHGERDADFRYRILQAVAEGLGVSAHALALTMVAAALLSQFPDTAGSGHAPEESLMNALGGARTRTPSPVSETTGTSAADIAGNVHREVVRALDAMRRMRWTRALRSAQGVALTQSGMRSFVEEAEPWLAAVGIDWPSVLLGTQHSEPVPSAMMSSASTETSGGQPEQGSSTTLLLSAAESVAASQVISALHLSRSTGTSAATGVRAVPSSSASSANSTGETGSGGVSSSVSRNLSALASRSRAAATMRTHGENVEYVLRSWIEAVVREQLALHTLAREYNAAAQEYQAVSDTCASEEAELLTAQIHVTCEERLSTDLPQDACLVGVLTALSDRASQWMVTDPGGAGTQSLMMLQPVVPLVGAVLIEPGAIRHQQHRGGIDSLMEARRRIGATLKRVSDALAAQPSSPRQGQSDEQMAYDKRDVVEELEEEKSNELR